MTQDYKHPITPPPEQIGDWWMEWDALDDSEQPRLEDFMAIKAAQWGADQELEACCEWLDSAKEWNTRIELRAARRPKPPSLKAQALADLHEIYIGQPFPAGDSRFNRIRRALEQLDG
jgi:hypothetical protein